MTIQITSSAFKEGEMIPQKYTCEGENISPPLSWTEIPAKTKSLALISDDPDSRTGTWVHWVIFNLPPDIQGLPEKVLPEEKLENGARQGTNGFRRIGYGGPCPPSGSAHRYNFKIYALDKMLELKPGATKIELRMAMGGHILDEGRFQGKFKR